MHATCTSSTARPTQRQTTTLRSIARAICAQAAREAAHAGATFCAAEQGGPDAPGPTWLSRRSLCCTSSSLLARQMFSPLCFAGLGHRSPALWQAVPFHDPASLSCQNYIHPCNVGVAEIRLHTRRARLADRQGRQAGRAPTSPRRCRRAAGGAARTRPRRTRPPPPPAPRPARSVAGL